MKLIGFLIIFFFCSLSLWSQEGLSLEASIMERWTTYRPESVDGLNWKGDSDMFTFMKDDKMVQQKAGAKSSTALLTIDDFNKALGIELARIPRLKWTSASDFSFRYNGAIYLMSHGPKGLLKKGMIPMPKGANHDFHEGSKNIAFTLDNNLYFQNEKGKVLEITSSEDANIISGQAIARYEFGIGKGTFWSPDGSFLAFYQKDETDIPNYPLLDITTTPGSVKNIKYPMAGQKSEYAKVGVFNTKTGKLNYLKVKGPKDQYLTNVGWGPENKFVYVAVVNREQNHVWLNQYDAKTGDFVKTLFEEEHPKYVEPEHPVWFIPGNNKEFLWWSERDGFMHLHRYNVEGKHLGQVTKGNWVTLENLGLDASGKNVLVKGTDASGLNTTVYSAPLAGGKASKRLIKEDGIHNVKLSANKKYLIDNYSSIKQPNVTRILDLKGKVLNHLIDAANPFDEKEVKVSMPELLELKGTDGTMLNARLIKPANFDATKKYPVIVYVYGGPHAQMVTNSWMAAAPLWMYHAANKGYLVFTLDNRGSANRGFEFENAIHRQLSKLEMEDQMTGVEYLKTLAYADTDRMAVHGWSYGGFMTTSLMLKYPDVFKVGVAGGPVTDWSYYEIMYGERYMDMPSENPEGYKETQLKNHVRNLKGDLLLIHGTVDDVVLMQHNFSLIQAFVENGILMDFFPYPMHPHNVRGKDRVHLMNKVLTYIDDKLEKE